MSETLYIELVEEVIELHFPVSLEGPPGDPGPPGPPGDGTLTATAATPISSGRLLSVIDGVASYFDPAGSGEPTGVAITAALQDAELTLVLVGMASVSGWGLTPGATYYAGPNGTITAIPPGADRVQAIGVALDTDTLNINIQQPIIL
jgi:hypothetical protein